MSPRTLSILTAGALAGLAVCTPAPALADKPAEEPTLEARALLPADATFPAPFAGIPNTDPAPAPGAVQPVGGFSAIIDGGHGTYWAMPDNGFGNKANSRSFLLRLYRVRPDFSSDEHTGSVEVLDAITLRDPDHKIPFRIVNDATSDRLLTGGDFDVESVRMARDGTLWFGEEFGPFLVNVDDTGKVLRAPIPLPDVKSPDYPPDFPAPFGGPANLASSNGFEGMALSKDGRHLLPTLEGPVSGDDPHLRRMYEFDLRTARYTTTRRTYRVEDPSLLVSDLTALDGEHLVSLERDNFQGPAAVHKRAFVVDLGRDEDVASTVPLPKRQVLDLLDIADPEGISLPGRPGDFGLGDPFKMPYVTIEAVLPQGGRRLVIVNDTNFGSTGRNPSLPDYSDFIEVRVPGLKND